MREAFVRQLTALAEKDPRIMLITGDLGFGVLTDYAKRFPRQFLNAGVAEQLMTGVAAGMAMEGRIVFTYSIGNFCTLRCLEQIRNDVAYHDLNVTVVSVGGGFSYGSLGISHYATEDLAILRSIPNVTVVAPGDDWETMEATRALTETPGPGYLRLDRTAAGETKKPGEVFRLGKARVLRDGDALSLVACGGLVTEALQAAERLEKSGVRSRVISCHTLKPLDRETLFAAARETGGIVTIEEHNVDGGLGGACAEILLEEAIRPRVFHRIGIRGGFPERVGSQPFLRRRYGMDAEAIAGKAREILRKSSC